MIIRLYEDCMGRLHLRANGTLYCNVHETDGSFLADTSALAEAGAVRTMPSGLSYRVVAGMFKRRGGPRLLATWKDGRVTVYKTPVPPSGCRYLMPEPSSTPAPS